MSHDDRKAIAELVTRYTYHPEFCDVYVEGQFDCRLIRWLLDEAGINDVTVYDIDGVSISYDILKKYNLSEGKKQRTIALAYELNNLIEDRGQVTCIADRDFDTLLSRKYDSPFLLIADFGCQEMYLFSEQVFRKFLALVARNYRHDAATLIATIVPLLLELHLIRATNESLELRMTWLPIFKCCQYSDRTLTFDRQDFIQRYLSKNERLGDLDRFIAERDRLAGMLCDDCRHHISKDDLFDVLHFVLSHYGGGKSLGDPEMLGKSLTACVEHAYLIEQNMYEALLKRVRLHSRREFNET